MFAALFAAIKVFGIWRRVSGAFGALWQAACKHPVGALLAVSLLANAWQLFDHSEQLKKAAHQHAADVAAFAGERAAFASVMHSYGVIRAALAGQNASIERAQAAGDAAHRAQQAALAADAGDASHRAALAQAQTDDAAKQGTAPGCATPQGVMNQKGDL